MRACLNADALSVTDRMNISFALGKAFDDCGQYDEAFEYYLQANSLKRQTFNYSIEIDRQRLQRLQAVFTPALITEKQGHGLSDWQPIFIVGMPRSGTTLIESILAAHSQLQGVGELDDLRQILTPDYEVYNGIDTIGSETLRNLANDYFQRTEVYTQGLRPIDKMPSNFWRIGMLKLLFPQAIIIHCCRNAMDTCVSIFKQNFSGAHRYAYSLTELGQYYNVYQSVMAYWHQLFPGSIHDVHYEQLVADPEAESRRLLSLVGVEWEPACAEFYRRDRSIQTVSLQQARQPVYASSVGGWRRYEPFLEALTNQPGLQHE